MLRLSSPRFPSPLRSRSSLPSPSLPSQAHRLTGLWAAMPAFTPINLGRATTTSLSLAQNPSCRTRTSLRDTIFIFHDLRRFRKRILRGRGVNLGHVPGCRRALMAVPVVSESQSKNFLHPSVFGNVIFRRFVCLSRSPSPTRRAQHTPERAVFSPFASERGY